MALKYREERDAAKKARLEVIEKAIDYQIAMRQEIKPCRQAGLPRFPLTASATPRGQGENRRRGGARPGSEPSQGVPATRRGPTASAPRLSPPSVNCKEPCIRSGEHELAPVSLA